MRHVQNWREKYPKTTFDTRALPDINGALHLVTMERWYWQKLKLLLKVGYYESLDEITQVCIRHAKMRNEQIGQDINHAFSLVLMRFIYGNYQNYFRVKNGIANNFWKPHF